MRRTGVQEIWENGQLIALPSANTAHVNERGGKRGRMTAGQPCTTKVCPTASPVAPHPVEVQLFLSYPATTNQPVSFNYNIDLGLGVPSFSAKYGNTMGPRYKPLNVPKDCIAETVATIGSVATAIATWISNHGSSYSSNVVEWAGWFLAGEITAAEFVAVMFAILASAEMLAILGTLLLTASSIYMLYKCMHG